MSSRAVPEISAWQRNSSSDHENGRTSSRRRLRHQFSAWYCLFSSFLSPSYFFLGALFTHWIADSLTLWKSPVTDEHLWTAASYYSILAKGPSAIFYVLGAVVLLGGATILWSLNDLRAGNIMFDGGSICGCRIGPCSLCPSLTLVCPQSSPFRHDHCHVH